MAELYQYDTGFPNASTNAGFTASSGGNGGVSRGRATSMLPSLGVRQPRGVMQMQAPPPKQFQPMQGGGRDPWVETQMAYRNQQQQQQQQAARFGAVPMGNPGGGGAFVHGGGVGGQPRVAGRFGQQQQQQQQQRQAAPGGMDPNGNREYAMPDYGLMDPQAMQQMQRMYPAQAHANPQQAMLMTGQQNAFVQQQQQQAGMWPRSRFPPVAGAVPRDPTQAQMRMQMQMQAQAALMRGGVPVGMAVPQMSGGRHAGDFYSGPAGFGAPGGRPPATDPYSQMPQMQQMQQVTQLPQIPPQSFAMQSLGASSSSLMHQQRSATQSRQKSRSRRMSTSSLPNNGRLQHHNHRHQSSNDLYADPVSRMSLVSRESEALRRHKHRLSTPTERRNTLTTSERYRTNNTMPASYIGIDFEPYTYRDYRNLKSRDQNMRLPQGLGHNETEEWRMQHEKRTRMHDYAALIESQDLFGHGMCRQASRAQHTGTHQHHQQQQLPVQRNAPRDSDLGRAASEFGTYDSVQESVSVHSGVGHAKMQSTIDEWETRATGLSPSPQSVSVSSPPPQQQPQLIQEPMLTETQEQPLNYAQQSTQQRQQAVSSIRKPLPGIRPSDRQIRLESERQGNGSEQQKWKSSQQQQPATAFISSNTVKKRVPLRQQKQAQAASDQKDQTFGQQLGAPTGPTPSKLSSTGARHLTKRPEVTGSLTTIEEAHTSTTAAPLSTLSSPAAPRAKPIGSGRRIASAQRRTNPNVTSAPVITDDAGADTVSESAAFAPIHSPIVINTI